MRAILTSVDYAAELAVTLPRNRHHFESVTVVTTPGSRDAQVAREQGAAVVTTDAFYRDGAPFAKWLALEEGLDVVGRHGWLCVLDADVVWPARLPSYHLQPGCLYTPLRRMLVDWSLPLPERWDHLPLHPNFREWAGYTQVFHADDPALGPPPWHEVDWIHAGGADSAFQRKWHPARKVRPPFEVLHLGPAGVNWCGRGGQDELARLLALRRVRRDYSAERRGR